MNARLLRWHLWVRRRIGWLPVLAALGVLGSLAVIGWASRVLTTETSAPSRSAAATPSPHAAEPPTSSARTLMASLPPRSRMAADLHTIVAAARRHGIDLPKGDYQLLHEHGLPVLMLVVALPIDQPFPAVRDFVAEVVNDLPNAALDDLGLQRGSAEEARIGARVQLTLMYRERP